jgi:hypothetical protein
MAERSLSLKIIAEAKVKEWCQLSRSPKIIEEVPYSLILIEERPIAKKIIEDLFLFKKNYSVTNR